MKNSIVKIMILGICIVLIGSIPLIVNAVKTNEDSNLIELRADRDEKIVEWKYKGENEEFWRQLFTYEDIQGERGDKGLQGLTGLDGSWYMRGEKGNDAYCTCN